MRDPQWSPSLWAEIAGWAAFLLFVAAVYRLRRAVDASADRGH